MRSTPEEIRRRIAKRKRDNGGSEKGPKQEISWPGDEEKYGFEHYSSFENGNDEGNHPLFKKEVFLFKILASIVLFLVIGILFKENTATFAPAREFVANVMDKDFKFAAVSKWYEDNFGKPLALLPFNEEEKPEDNTVVESEYSVPASGKILENFEKNGQGIMIETGKGASVEAMNEGMVSFAGVKEGLGKTVIIQHSDQTESWYGNLDEVKVNLYEYVDKETEIGTVSDSAGEDKTKGKYYFAIKKGDDFIDPIQVIHFE
jgi:stage IV sporulation protein FA